MPLGAHGASLKTRPEFQTESKKLQILGLETRCAFCVKWKVRCYGTAS